MTYKLPEGWRTVKLGDISGENSGMYGINESAVEYDSDLYRYLRITDIKDDGTIDESKKVSVNISKVENSKYLLNKNDIVLARTGASAGRNYFYNGEEDPMIFAGFLIKFALDESKVNPEYIKYYCQSKEYKDWVKSVSTGSTRPNINAKMYSNMVITLPQFDQQQLLVDTLSALDNKIELNNKINENLEQQAQAIFKHWFIDFEFPDENGNPYKSSGGEMVESELGMIPKGWKVAKLKDISERENGYSYRSVDMNEESNNKLLTLKNFNRNGGYDNSHYRRIDITDRVREHHYVKDGNILLACTDLTQNGEVVGNAIRYFSTDKFDNALMSMDLVKIVPKDLKDNLYIYYLLKNRNFKEYAKNHSTGTTVLHFKKSSIDDFRIVKPRKEIINSFTDIIQNIEKKIINNYIQNQNLSQLRDTLLPKLMSGELRIPLD